MRAQTKMPEVVERFPVTEPSASREVDIIPARQGSLTFNLVDGRPLYHSVQGEARVHGAISQYTLDIPIELGSSMIITYMNGLFAFKKTMRGISRATAAEGYPSLRSAPIRKSERNAREDLFDATGLHADTMQAVFDSVATNPQLKDMPNGDKLTFDKFNLGPHSYAGDVAVRYALLHPENVQNIVFIKAVGMEKRQGLRILNRLPKFAALELVPFLRDVGPDFGPSDVVRAIKHIGGDPILALGEIRACMLADNRRHLWPLGDKGIGLGLLSGDKDNLIPADPMEELAAQLVDHYERLDTDHLGPQRNPYIVSAAVIRTIHEIARKKAYPVLQSVPQQRVTSPSFTSSL